MKIMEKQKEIAAEILSLNKGALLSGSLALKLNNRKIRREPEDIDILVKDEDFKMPERAIVIDDEMPYNEPEFVFIVYSVDGVSVNIFYAQGIVYHHESPHHVVINGKWFDILPYYEILKFKMKHAYDNAGQPEKHRLDLVYFFENNL